MKPVRLHQHLERVFNIREGEGLLVRQLFFHNFFQGTGIAFYFTAANALFLDFFSIKWLPWMYLLAGGMLLLTGRIYAYFEHHLQVRKFMVYVVLVLISAPLIFYLGLALWKMAGVIFLLMASHRVLYTLNSLEFWGLSALAFDIRQSKRIFPLIGAGDIPAKLLGYLAVVVFIPYIGIESLLLFSSGCFLLSFIFLRQLLNTKAEFFNSEDKHHDFEQVKKEPSRILIRSIFKSHFLFWISALSVVALLTLTLLDFSFLSEVKYSFKEKKDLAQFFGFLFSGGYGLIIIIKLFFSGRIIEKLGVVRSAFILPFFLLICGCIALITGFLSNDSSIMLWIFSAIVIGVDVIRYSIDDPNLMTLFQPLSKSLRLFGHTLMKALMQPLGLIFAGFLLMVLLYFFQQLSLWWVSVLLVTGSVILFLITLQVKKHYVLQLQKAVRTRYFEGSDLIISGGKLQEILEKHLQAGSAREAIHSMTLLHRDQPNHWPQLLAKALKHNSPEVRSYAIDLIRKENILTLKNKLLEILNEDQSPQVKEAAIQAIPTLAPEHIEKINPYLENEHSSLKLTAYVSLLHSKYLKGTVHAGEKLLGLFNATDSERRVFAIRVLGQLGNANDYQLLKPLLKDKDQVVQKYAVKAAGNIRHPDLLVELFQLFDENPNLAEVQKAIAKFKHLAINQIAQRLHSKKATVEHKVYLSTILSQIEEKKANKLLLEQLNDKMFQVRNRALFALKQKQFRVDDKSKDLIDQQFYFELASAFRMLYAERNCKPDSNSLKVALQQNRHIVEGCILTLLELQFDRRRIQRVRECIYHKNTEYRAKALELLEYELPKSMYLPFSILLDQQQGYGRIIKFDKIQKSGIDYPVDWRKDILKKQCRIYSQWTVTMAIDTIQENGLKYKAEIVALASHESQIIREQALQYLESRGLHSVQNNIEMETQFQAEDHLLLIEKILLLKNTSLFYESPEEILIDVARIAREVELAEGECLFEKGDMGDKMYIIASGKVKIHDGDHVFSYLEEHGIFGELALLDPEPRSASATAEEDSLLLFIDQDPFYELLSTHPEVAKGIMSILGSRLRSQNEEIVRMKNKIK